MLDDHDRSRRDFVYLNYSHPETGAPGADIRIGYARYSHLTQELPSQPAAPAAHGIPRDKVFCEKISSRVRVRPQFEAALTLAREIKAHAPHCRVPFTVYEMKRLARDAAELIATAEVDLRQQRGAVLVRSAGDPRRASAALVAPCQNLPVPVTASVGRP
ncbi:recombinase family protein [Streptomyces sp. NPDC101733]|uniref:recombinase family protein n=1 Tax=unclassified Streptomyces TaxID=2593676 RepID=UPI0037FCBD9C